MMHKVVVVGLDGASPELTVAEREQIKQKLKALGYL